VATPLFPLFLKLAGRRVVLVGAGRVAAEKLRHLLDAGADVTVVAPDVESDIAAAPVRIVQRAFQPSDLHGAWLVVSAAPAPVNREVAAAAEERHIFVNAVDDVACASAYAAAVLRRQELTVAISTDGVAPALAGLFREAIDALIPRDLSEWFAASRRARADWVKNGVPMRERRPLLLQALNKLYAGKEGLGFTGGSQESVEAAPDVQGDRGVLASSWSSRSPREAEART
jgi:uroporphyrin-III C-methyltransferase / precorrin-2 dehydrogenase / sirohydrochlorin ferrochelatase